MDYYYAVGEDELTAKGRYVLDPSWGHFQVRHPNKLFLTIKNNDVLKTALEKPISVDYWLDLFNPLDGEEEKENTEPI